MPRSLAVYVSNGKQRDYSVPFTYIKREYVRVIGTQYDEKGRRIGSGVPLDFTWINNGLVRLNDPYPAGGRISIERWTYAESSLVDYQDAASLTEEDLDLGDRQGLHVAQEARDRLEGVDGEIEALRDRDDELEDRIEEIDRLRLPRQHASQHFATGDDPIPPAAIGALTAPPDDGKAYLATGLGWLEYIQKASDGTGARVVMQAHRFSSDGIATSFPVRHTLNSENVSVQTFDADTGERVYFGERVDGLDCVTLASGVPLPAGKSIRVLLFAPGDGDDGGGTSDHAELTNRDAVDQHPQSAITGLTDDLEEIRSGLDDKADEADMLARLQTKANAASLAGKADVGHTHADKADVSALAGKADASHTHAQVDVTGLSAALSVKADAASVTASLAGKADSGHAHSAATGATAGFLSAADKVKLDKVPADGGVGKTEFNAAVGAVNGRCDMLADAVEAIPAGVVSVNGKTGTVTLALADLSDVAAAINARAPTASPAFTGTPTAPTPAAATNTQQIATTAFVQTAVGAVKPVSYTTAEQDTKLTWFDGKKVYQKTIDAGTLPANGNKSVAHSIANLAAIVGCEGIANNLPTMSVPDSHSVLNIYFDQTNAIIQADPLLSGFRCIVTVWYTCSNR